jgi:uncharacterized protein (DUF1697 family)
MSGAITTYIAMLRGVNVGQKTIRMERLRATFETLGFSAIRSYVQSGNVVFQTKPGSLPRLSESISRQIQRDFDFEVPVLLRTSKEMENVVRCNPFVKNKAIDHSKLHVTFLSDAPPEAVASGLEPLASKSERFRVLGRQVYLYCPDGYGRTKLSNGAIERKLSVVATTRNWRTVNALLEMAQS